MSVTLTLEELGGWPFVLGRLASRADLSAAEAAAALTDVLDGNATPSQLAAFMFGLRCKGETVEEMTGLVRAMIGASEPVPCVAIEASLKTWTRPPGPALAPLEPNATRPLELPPPPPKPPMLAA